MKKISIVTPSYNQGAFIAEAIESVLAQKDPCFEHIVIDGASKDNTIEVLKAYPHIKWISEPDKGQSDAVNKGFRMASGDIFGEINADDYYLPGAFAAVRREMDKENAPEVVTGGQINLRNGVASEIVRPQKASFKEIIRYPENPVSHPGTFYSRRIWEAINGIDTSVKYAPDVDLFIRMSKVSDFKCIPENLAVNRIHEAGIQGRECERNWLASLYHIARHGNFKDFEEMSRLTFSWIHDGKTAESQGCQDDVDWHRAYVKCRMSYLLTNSSGIALAGGGQFAVWLIDIAKEIDGMKISAIIDDNSDAPAGKFGIEHIPFGGISKERFDVVVLASDTVAEKLKDKVTASYGTTVKVFNIYDRIDLKKPAKKFFYNFLKSGNGFKL